MTAKILALTDAMGNLVRFRLTPGNRFDSIGVAPLIDGVAFGAFIAGKAFDSNDIIANPNESGPKIGISQHPRRASSCSRSPNCEPPKKGPQFELRAEAWRNFSAHAASMAFGSTIS